jgi:hypothetical protein
MSGENSFECLSNFICQESQLIYKKSTRFHQQLTKLSFWIYALNFHFVLSMQMIGT